MWKKYLTSNNLAAIPVGPERCTAAFHGSFRHCGCDKRVFWMTKLPIWDKATFSQNCCSLHALSVTHSMSGPSEKHAWHALHASLSHLWTSDLSVMWWLTPCCCPVSGCWPGWGGAGCVGLQQLDTRSRNAPDTDGGRVLIAAPGLRELCQIGREEKTRSCDTQWVRACTLMSYLQCVCLHTVACEAALRSLKKIFYLINKNIPYILVVPSV